MNNPSYPPLSRTLAARLTNVGRLAWRTLALKPADKGKAFGGYVIAAALAAYAMAHLLYELNIHLVAVFRLPLWNFYSEQLIPFLTAPFKWIGIDLNHILKPLLVLSGLGAAL